MVRCAWRSEVWLRGCSVSTESGLDDMWIHGGVQNLTAMSSFARREKGTTTDGVLRPSVDFVNSMNDLNVWKNSLLWADLETQIFHHHLF